MFSTKQSDIFYNDDTKEMVVCTVSSISAERCEDNSTVYGALPIIYKIDKETNYKRVVYPKNLSTFTTDLSSDLYNLTTICTTITGNNFDSITKPLINYNKTSQRYSVTFVGKYATQVEGLGINNFIFQEVDNTFQLLDTQSLLPQDTLVAVPGTDTFSFEGGYINSDLYIGGNTIRNGKPSWFNPDDGHIVERSPDYQVAPTYVDSTSSLAFNVVQHHTDTTVLSLTGDTNLPFMYNGGYVTYNPKYTAFDLEKATLRVDFRARSFWVDPMTALGGTQATGTTPSRWVQAWDPSSQGPGEGFSVFFYKNPEKDSYIVPNGIGSTFGYAEAEMSVNEVAGTAQHTVGLFRRTSWDPNLGISKKEYELISDTGNIGYGDLGVGNIGAGTRADSILGVGFDIAGNFCTTSEDKFGHYNSSDTTATALPCSVGVRGSSYFSTKVLSCLELSAVPGATNIPLHVSGADAEFVDYRIDLANKGTLLTVYHKLTSATDYNTILELRLDKIPDSSGVLYDPWKGLKNSNGSLPLVNVGLSFTTSDKASKFELKSFQVKGIEVNNPWRKLPPSRGIGNLASLPTRPVDERTKIESVESSSDNLRKKVLNADTERPVDVDITVPITNQLKDKQQQDPADITLCDQNVQHKILYNADVKITNIDPQQIDKAIDVVAERGIDAIEFSPKTIVTGTYVVGDDDDGEIQLAKTPPVVKNIGDQKALNRKVPTSGWKFGRWCTYEGNPYLLVQAGDAQNTDGCETAFGLYYNTKGYKYKMDYFVRYDWYVLYRGKDLVNMEYGIFIKNLSYARTTKQGGFASDLPFTDGWAKPMIRKIDFSQINTTDNKTPILNHLLDTWANNKKNLKSKDNIWLLKNWDPKAAKIVPNNSGALNGTLLGPYVDALNSTEHLQFRNILSQPQFEPLTKENFAEKVANTCITGIEQDGEEDGDDVTSEPITTTTTTTDDTKDDTESSEGTGVGVDDGDGGGGGTPNPPLKPKIPKFPIRLYRGT